MAVCKANMVSGTIITFDMYSHWFVGCNNCTRTETIYGLGYGRKSIASPWYIPLGIVLFTSMQGGLKYL